MCLHIYWDTWSHKKALAFSNMYRQCIYIHLYTHTHIYTGRPIHMLAASQQLHTHMIWPPVYKQAHAYTCLPLSHTQSHTHTCIHTHTCLSTCTHIPAHPLLATPPPPTYPLVHTCNRLHTLSSITSTACTHASHCLSVHTKSNTCLLAQTHTSLPENTYTTHMHAHTHVLTPAHPHTPAYTPPPPLPIYTHYLPSPASPHSA